MTITVATPLDRPSTPEEVLARLRELAWPIAVGIHRFYRGIDPDDMVAAAAVQVGTLPQDYRIESPQAFVRTILIRLARRMQTDASRATNVDFSDEGSIPALAVEDATEQNVFVDEFRNEKISERQRAVIDHRIGGRGYAEIAQRLGIGEATVRRDMARVQALAVKYFAVE